MIREAYDDDNRSEVVAARAVATLTKTQRRVKRLQLQPNDLRLYLIKKRR